MIHKGHEECLNQFKRLREQRLASVTMGSGHFVTDTKYPDPHVTKNLSPGQAPAIGFHIKKTMQCNNAILLITP